LLAYDGTTCIGRIVTRDRSNHAFNAAGKLIGKFSDPRSAFRSIREAHLTATKARPAAPTDNNTSDRPEWRDAAAWCSRWRPVDGRHHALPRGFRALRNADNVTDPNGFKRLRGALLGRLRRDIRLSPIARLVGWEIAMLMNAEHDGYAWPSHEYLKDQLGIGVRSVKRAIAELE
jgi:hypothetical protein